MPTTPPRLHLAALVTTAVLALGAPAAYATLGPDSPAPTAATSVKRGKPYVETRLFFGTARPDGGPPVTDKQFLAFVDREITPHFPAGLTIQEGRGQWRNQHGTIERERSYELILLYPRSQARSHDAQIEGIRTAYERDFGQESVARADETAWVDF
ncbi:DUF3574 domain-containing protein [Streptomyces zagrosensis]|uniref:Choline dehydrogenase n=1 Tax=Streptomyces zagrosensis TaxID=1042984 RepID=A0A7W9QCM7_9ACTN|nr:DUF3574 domain-containing protein [Streptomyces zagrosensis]MBB5937810.1 hypothetical protein [Streptomyces zagrosensis]